MSIASLFDHHIPDEVRPLFCGECSQRWPCDSRDVADSHDALLAAAVAAKRFIDKGGDATSLYLQLDMAIDGAGAKS